MSIDLLLDHWELAMLLATWSVIGVVWIRRQHDWRNRRFTQQVNFSLTTPVDRDGTPTLLLRTLLEEGAAHVWLNEFGVSRVLKAARHTTREMPYLHIEQRRDRDLVMNAVLNVLSERYSDAFVARAVGIPIKTDVFLFGLTFERYGEMKTQKLRVILIRRADLQGLFGEGSGKREIRVVEDSHRPRIETLRRMYQLSTSSDQDDRDMIREVELGIATHAIPGDASG
jgi:hypothetical protein